MAFYRLTNKRYPEYLITTEGRWMRYDENAYNGIIGVPAPYVANDPPLKFDVVHFGLTLYRCIGHYLSADGTTWYTFERMEK